MLEANMGAILAEEALREHGGDLTSESLRALMEQAGCGEDDVADAYARRVLEETAPSG